MTRRTVMLKGTITSRLVDVGLKSERDGYFLKMVYDLEVQLLAGENPFDQPKLRSLVGRRCDVYGHFSDSTFIADRIVPK